MSKGEHPSGQCGPMPEDPFPDVTLMDVPGVTVRTFSGEEREVCPSTVIAVKVLARDLDGNPTLIQPL